jgi:t-SNARE complex subunit (syntaxin)
MYSFLVLLVKPDASPEEIDDVLDSDEPPQIFAQSVSTKSTL